MKHFILFPILLIAALSWAGTCPYGDPAHLDPSSLTILEGRATVVSIAWGQGQPSVTVGTSAGNAVVLLGPIWYMDQNQFTIEVGNTLTVKAFKSVQNGAADYIAQEITNVDKSTSLAFRDANGYPLWKGHGNGNGHGAGSGSGSGQGHRQGSGRP